MSNSTAFRYKAIEALKGYLDDPKPSKMQKVNENLSNAETMIIGAVAKIKKVSTDLKVDLTK